jgi:hypothetical protein
MNSLNLTWTASSDNVGVTGYDVYYADTKVGSTSTTNYNVTGLAASTAYSFTVRAKDAAGNISGSSNTVNVITLPIVDSVDPIQSYSLYPNPLSGSELNVTFNSNTSSQALLQLMDVRGIVLISENVLTNVGKNHYTLDTYSLKPGLYFVTVTVDGFTMRLKLMVQG